MRLSVLETSFFFLPPPPPPLPFWRQLPVLMPTAGASRVATVLRCCARLSPSPLLLYLSRASWKTASRRTVLNSHCTYDEANAGRARLFFPPPPFFFPPRWPEPARVAQKSRVWQRRGDMSVAMGHGLRTDISAFFPLFPLPPCLLPLPLIFDRARHC